FRNQSNAVNAMSVGNLGDQLARVLIDHHHTVGAGDKQPPPFGIHCQIIPTAIAPDFPGLRYFVSWRGLRADRQRQSYDSPAHDQHESEKLSHGSSALQGNYILNRRLTR